MAGTTWKTWRDLEQEIGLPPMDEYFQGAFETFAYQPGAKLLDRHFMKEHQNTFHFCDELMDELFAAEDEICASPALHYAACFLRYAIFEHKRAYEDPYMRDIYPACMGDRKGMFPMVVYCANTPIAYAQILARGLDVNDVAGNFASLNSFAQGYRAATGHWGLSGCGWNVICSSEFLNTVGSLRFAPAVIGDRFAVYHNPATGRYLCLAEAGIACGEDGLLDAEHPAFYTQAHLDGDRLTAHEVTFKGIICRQSVTVSLLEWEKVLGPGDTVLEYHIPTAPGYVPARVLKSFRKGLYYFAEHFPELKIKGFWCYSWLYCPQMEEILGGKKCAILDVFNVLRHVPVDSGADCFHPFVFDVPFSTPVEDLPEDTRLRRGIKRMRLEGKRLCAGGVMMPLGEYEKMEALYANEED